MTDAPRQIAVVRDHDELVDALRARKDALGLSDQFVDECCFETGGHCNQVLGPSRRKNLGRKSLDGLLITLGCALVLVEDAERVRFMEAQWESRVAYNIRPHLNRVSRAAVERVKPAIFSEMGRRSGEIRNTQQTVWCASKIGRKGGRATARNLTREQRAQSARRAAIARWAKAKKTDAQLTGKHASKGLSADKKRASTSTPRKKRGTSREKPAPNGHFRASTANR